jgi:hypothetical protein
VHFVFSSFVAFKMMPELHFYRDLHQSFELAPPLSETE